MIKRKIYVLLFFFVSSFIYAQNSIDNFERTKIEIDYIQTYKNSFVDLDNQPYKLFDNEQKVIEYINFLLSKTNLFIDKKYEIHILYENNDEWLINMIPAKTKNKKKIKETLDKDEGYYFILNKNNGRISYFQYLE